MPIINPLSNHMPLPVMLNLDSLETPLIQ
jgi:hypothetical protein